MSTRVPVRAGLALALVAAASATHATNGYFSHGYGIKSKGAAGVGAALPQDALVIATNPAGLIAVGNRLDVGLEYFVPERSGAITGNTFGADASYDANGTESFLIPEFGYNRLVGDNLAFGVAVYGNGGMNTDYAQNPYGRFGATGPVYMNLEQLFIAPAVAWQVSERNTLGLAVNLAYQRFEMKGISSFAPWSSDPANLSNNGVDDATGAGVRIGWTGALTDTLTLGASWQSKTDMSEFDNYAGLFADQGDFDIPETFVIGFAAKTSDATTVALDWQTIKYSGVAAVGNSVATLFGGTQPLGADNGPGFGWRDMKVVKVGAVHELNERVTLRGGYSYGEQPIPRSETFFNIIAPGVVQEHLTLGATFAVGEKSELSFEYAHAFSQAVHGDGSIPPGFPPAGLGGGEAHGKLKEDSFGVAWSLKY